MRRLTPAAPVLAGAIGLWLGVEAIRSYFTIIVWNVAEDLPSTQLGLVGAAFWIVGLLGWLPARLIGRLAPGPAAVPFAALVAVLTVLRQAVQDETLTAVLSIGTLVAWLWWLPAWIHAAARADRARRLVPGFLLGMAAQVAGQVALDGLDLHALPGLPGAMAGLLLGGTFACAVREASRTPEADVASATARLGLTRRWGGFAILPWLFLQLTLFANIGRLEALGAWSVPLAGLVSVLGLGLAALVIEASGLDARLSRLPLLGVAVGTAMLIVAAAAGGFATLLLVPAQVGLALLLQQDLGRSVGASAASRVWLANGLGGVLFFALLFTLYSTALDTLGPLVWPVAALLVALPGLLGARAADQDPRPARSLRSAAAILAVAVGADVMGGLPARPEQPIDARAPARLTVLDYNIHQGFSRTGYPNLERTAAYLRAQNADLILLQEVPRTWDLSGAVDTFSWLAERLPEYRAVYGATSRVRFGNAIFSRYPVRSSGSEYFPFGPSLDQRGFTWIELETAAGPLLVVTMHMTPYTRADEVAERDGQAQALLDFWAARGRGLVVFAGDYNSDPSDPAYARTVGGGLVDALRLAGLGDQITFRSTGTPFLQAGTEQIDYVFVNPSTRVVAAAIPDTEVSDHYPLLVTLDLARAP